jgi:hypothetical protein
MADAAEHLVLLGLRTVIHPSPDLEGATRWLSMLTEQTGTYDVAASPVAALHRYTLGGRSQNGYCPAFRTSR